MLVVAAFGWWTVRRSFPDIDGSQRLAGLSSDVSVVRDAQGVPHIYATNLTDLYMAQGYVHAQERFFQMDFRRHIGAARLSEMLGEATVDTDRFLRSMRFVATAREEFEAMTAEEQAIMQAYADGVNAYLAERSGAEISLEYAVLGLSNAGYEPYAWEPTDTLVWAKMMSWDLGSNLEDEISRALTAGAVGVTQTEVLWPPYPADHPVIVHPSEPTVRGGVSAPAVASTQAFGDVPSATWTQLAEDVLGVRQVTGESRAEIGSNNWVVDGSKTASGWPLLANDPHLSTQMPSIWFQIGLHCVGEEAGCPHHVAGFSLAGGPGVVIGHNDRIAWGVTNLAPDTQDLVIERINPDNPHQYELDGEWIDMEVFEEEILVAGGTPVEVEVRWTRNGPLIADTFGLEDFAETAGGVEIPPEHGLALRWTSLEPSTLTSSILQLNRAEDWEEFRQAVSSWDIAAQNMVYADVEGNIGYQATGATPIRAAGDGRWPVPGWTSEFDWAGTIPFGDLPSLFNPPGGAIVTANNAVVDETYQPPLTEDWAYGYRAERILERLAGAEELTTETMNQIQTDNRNLHAPELVPALATVESADESVALMQRMMTTWLDDDPVNAVDSPGAAAYNAVWRHLLMTLLDELDPETVDLSGRDRMFVVVNDLLTRPDDTWWDIADTPAPERRDDVLAQAMIDAHAELVDRLGPDPELWRWGEIHTVELRHGSLGESGIRPIEALFNRGPFEVPGGTSLVNAMSWSPADGYEVKAIPSMRMVVDLADFDASTAVHSTGQSGHAFHPRYTDQTSAWATGQTFPFRWSDAFVRSGAEGVLSLVP